MELTIAIVGGLIGIIPGVLGIIVPLIQSRSEQARAGREIKLGKEQVEFLESWLKARKETAEDAEHADIEAQVGVQLEEIRASLKDVFRNQLESSTRMTAATLRVRYAMTWFLASLGFTVFGTIAAFFDDAGQFNPDYFLSDTDYIYGIFFFVGLTAFLFYRWLRIRKEERV